MAHQVLQAGYVGEVQLFSGNPPVPLALVTVGSLTSSPVYVEPQREGWNWLLYHPSPHLTSLPSLASCPGSSDEEEDDIVFSDYRGSDSDSGEGTEVYRHSPHAHKLKNKPAKVLHSLTL